MTLRSRASIEDLVAYCVGRSIADGVIVVYGDGDTAASRLEYDELVRLIETSP